MQDRELAEVFRKRQNIFWICFLGSIAAIFLLTAGIMIFCSLAVDGNLDAVVKDLRRTSWQDVRLLAIMLGCYSVPFLLFYVGLAASGKQCTEAIWQMSAADLREFRSVWEYYKKGIRMGETLLMSNYFLYKEKWGFFLPRIIAYRDIVWLYLTDFTYQHTDFDQMIVTPTMHFYTVVFYTKDGKKHHILMGDHKSIVKHCPGCIKGYGKEQKELAGQQLLKWESMNSVIGQNRERKRRLLVGVVTVLVSAAVAGSAWGIWYDRYRQTDADSQQAKTGQYESLLALARENAALGSDSGTLYEMLITYYPSEAEVFLEAAQFYMEHQNYPDAFSTLERGYKEAGHEQLQDAYEDLQKNVRIEACEVYENGIWKEGVSWEEEEALFQGQDIAWDVYDYDQMGNITEHVITYADGVEVKEIAIRYVYHYVYTGEMW